jgi:hypothetical protein
MTESEVYNQFNRWAQTATEEEHSLAEKVAKFEAAYFGDMAFTPDSITGDFFAVKIQDDAGK